MRKESKVIPRNLTGRRRDDLTVISDVLWFESVALSPFKEHPNRFGVA